MQLSLQGLVPVPLREKIENIQSDVWNKTLTFNKNQQLFVRAPSGTGKTTLIHLLYGLRTDFSGLIAWDGDDITTLSPKDMATLRTKNLSIIFQDLRLFPDLTCLENINIKRQLTNAVDENTVISWLDHLGMADKLHTKAQILSYGEQQRTAIVRALVQPFDWLLMDEPFSHLDHNNIAKAVLLIKEVLKQKKAALLLADLDENSYFDYNATLNL